MRLAAALLFAAFPVAAATTVTLERAGTAVGGGEVCRFRAGDRENPFSRWLSSQALNCEPAGSPINFAPGLWNVFARDASGISPVHLIDAASAPQTLKLSLGDAATIKPLLPAGMTGVIYATRRATAVPVAQRTTVPAGEDLWLFVLDKTSIAAVVPIAALEPSAERSVDARSGGPAAVIGWLHVAESDRVPLAESRDVPPPAIRIGASRTSDPVAPLALLNGSFIRIREVPAGEHEVVLGGRGWLADRQRVNVASSITVATSPLRARPAATLIVNWSTAGDIPALERSLGACEERRDPPRYEVTLASCPLPARPTEPPDPKACTVIRKESFDPILTFGSFTAEDLPPGLYRAELKYGTLPTITAVAPAVALQQRSMRLNASYMEIYGGVSHGGEPLKENAVIEFPGGYGFASAEKGEYRAVLRTFVGLDEQINVGACDGSPHAIVFTDRQIRPNTRFDIDIPANELAINITDTFTREFLEGATVRYAVMSTRVPRRPIYTRTFTAEQGQLVLTAVPEREIQVSVSHAGYQKQDLEPFSMTKSQKKSIDVQLMPLRGNRGRIHSPKLFDNAAIFWFGPDGFETERAELSSDGTFVYANVHGASETMIVLSQSHPLWILRAPALERRQTFELRFPDVAAREFDIFVKSGDRRDSRFVSIVVGKLRVPLPVLRGHQNLRNLPSVVRGPGPLHIGAIAETGPIEVLLGPNVEEISTRASGMDFFALPQFADLPRRALGPGATSVVFD